jgi:hypothetical protein
MTQRQCELAALIAEKRRELAALERELERLRQAQCEEKLVTLTAAASDGWVECGDGVCG